MGLSIDMRRLLGLICVSETVVYAQVNQFRDQINSFTPNACQHLDPNDRPDWGNTVFREDINTLSAFKVKKCIYFSLLKKSFPFRSLAERSWPSLSQAHPSSPSPVIYWHKDWLSRNMRMSQVLSIPLSLHALHNRQKRSCLALSAFTQSSDFSHQRSPESAHCVGGRMPDWLCVWVPSHV